LERGPSAKLAEQLLQHLTVSAQHGLIGPRLLQDRDQPVHVSVHPELVERPRVETERGGQRLERLAAAQRWTGKQPLDPEPGEQVDQGNGLLPAPHAERALGVRAGPVSLVASIGMAHQHTHRLSPAQTIGQ
jgi:hypothetical protein